MLEIILVVFIILLLLARYPKVPKNFPPGPKTYPIIGAFPHIDLNDVSNIGPELTRTYGSISGLVFPFLNTVAIDKWDAMQELYANDDCQGRPDVILIRDRFTDGRNFGVLFTDGENHKQQRKFVLHNFRHIGFGRRSHESLIQDEAMELVKDVDSMDGKPFHIEEMFYLTNINITWALMSSERHEHSDPKLKLLASGIKMVIHDVGIVGSMGNLFPILRHIFPQSTGYASVIRGSKIIRTFAKNSIKEHKKFLDINDPKDFLDSYLAKIEEEKGKETYFTEDELMGVCMDFLLAGADTSTGTMCFTTLFLALNRDKQERVYQEILEVIGPNRSPSVDDRSELIYCEAFMNEVFRYRAIAPVYPPHRVMKDTTLMGYNIPKDTIIFPDIRMILMDKDHYGDPENFRPERYITEDGKIKRDERLLPFGKGKRSCLGEPLARMSSFLIFLTLVQNFEFSLPPGEENPDTNGKPGFTLTPPEFRVIATKRN